jgi:hypothetical protein
MKWIATDQVPEPARPPIGHHVDAPTAGSLEHDPVAAGTLAR